MRLPSSSSLLAASLAVSLSSSSLSALAAPTGDLPEDSSSPNPVAHCRDSTVVRSVGAPFVGASAFLSDITTDHPQSRSIEDIKKIVGDLVKDVLGALPIRSAADEDSTAPDSTTTPLPPPAPPSSPAVKPPVPRNPPSEPPIERRDSLLDNVSGRSSTD